MFSMLHELAKGFANKWLIVRKSAPVQYINSFGINFLHPVANPPIRILVILVGTNSWILDLIAIHE